MKKFITCILASVCAVICAFGFVACTGAGNGGSGGNGDNGGNTGNEQPQRVAVTEVKLNKSALTLDTDGTETLTATVLPENATNKTVSWSSDKPEIATVVNGKVTAIAEGTAIITATADGKSAVCTVTVNKKNVPDGNVAVTEVKLDKLALTLDIDGTETLTATVSPENATNKTVSWSSDKPEIVTVVNGKVTAIAEGTAIITATADGKSATCTVTVNKATTPPDDTNKYAPIVTALQERTGKEILLVFVDNDYLTFFAKSDTEISKVKANINVGSGTALDTEFIVSEIATVKLRNMDEHKFEYCKYTTDNNSETVQQMITKLLGDGYKVIYGTISDKRDNMDHPTLGANASFDVCAVLEKDGRVYEYSETVTATKRLGDVYQAVLNSTEANKDNIYKCNNKTPADLGDVAASYLAEVKRVEEATKQ